MQLPGQSSRNTLARKRGQFCPRETTDGDCWNWVPPPPRPDFRSHKGRPGRTHYHRHPKLARVPAEPRYSQARASSLPGRPRRSRPATRRTQTARTAGALAPPPPPHARLSAVAQARADRRGSQAPGERGTLRRRRESLGPAARFLRGAAASLRSRPKPPPTHPPAAPAPLGARCPAPLRRPRPTRGLDSPAAQRCLRPDAAVGGGGRTDPHSAGEAAGRGLGRKEPPDSPGKWGGGARAARQVEGPPSDWAPRREPAGNPRFAVNIDGAEAPRLAAGVGLASLRAWHTRAPLRRRDPPAAPGVLRPRKRREALLDSRERPLRGERRRPAQRPSSASPGRRDRPTRCGCKHRPTPTPPPRPARSRLVAALSQAPVVPLLGRSPTSPAGREQEGRRIPARSALPSHSSGPPAPAKDRGEAAPDVAASRSSRPPHSLTPRARLQRRGAPTAQAPRRQQRRLFLASPPAESGSPGRSPRAARQPSSARRHQEPPGLGWAPRELGRGRGGRRRVGSPRAGHWLYGARPGSGPPAPRVPPRAPIGTAGPAPRRPPSPGAVAGRGRPGLLPAPLPPRPGQEAAAGAVRPPSPPGGRAHAARRGRADRLTTRLG
ncbi:basic proline-rich protein-like [Sphaerodactylus townsendi]|uniref:basic proline-rich protein-like n=1 Tax=Sphaerodactylus townsendi TaxID=933632 RepID=UPI00202747AA|nr:basic proline-rich protein-like [Sphaerodactylus townsendi]